MTDTWIAIDLPVLRTAVEWIEGSNYRETPSSEDIAEMLGLTVDEVYLALKRLDGVYVTIGETMGGTECIWPERILPPARVAIGQWPSPESLADQIVAELGKEAAAEPDPEKRSKLRRVAAELGGVAKGALVGAAAAALTKGMGIG